MYACLCMYLLYAVGFPHANPTGEGAGYVCGIVFEAADGEP